MNSLPQHVGDGVKMQSGTIEREGVKLIHTVSHSQYRVRRGLLSEERVVNGTKTKQPPPRVLRQTLALTYNLIIQYCRNEV